jgi:hypothetical protein
MVWLIDCAWFRKLSRLEITPDMFIRALRIGRIAAMLSSDISIFG